MNTGTTLSKKSMARQSSPDNQLREIPLISRSVLEKYNTTGPRYTSYPTVPEWTADFGPAAYEQAVRHTNLSGNTSPLSLYVHLPFCESRCLFCGCNVVITRHHEASQKYLDYLYKEMEQVARWMDTSRPVAQSHWGGGTPTFLTPEEITQLFRFKQKLFNFSDDAEIGIEVDPRVTTDDHLVTLKELGFNRISMGVQDFDPTVQEAIHRIQPVDMTGVMIHRCRELGFESINVDLIYGLPHQQLETFQLTLKHILALSPDRIALYNYAHVPWMAPHQKHIDEASLPDGAEKFRIFQKAIETLIEAGFVYIGMDHFAKPTDELTLAQEDQSLHRNFMGFTTQKGCDLYGFGVSAISGLHGHYSQNQRKLTDYYQAVDKNIEPTMRGLALSEEDILHREVINTILGHARLDYHQIEAEFKMLESFGAPFKTYFKDALEQLTPMAEDGLLRLTETGFELTLLGRILSRNVAMPFDAYLKVKDPDKTAMFSKTV
ncbi:MAG: oxygen-independent coproporphyrinogen III oxidase [Vampirovibrio sp.]|nr:oxygen-independent coproporphyrinogen III oxidase [Vampirovibrio sp.]